MDISMQHSCRQMPDGVIAFGPEIILDLYEQVVKKQIQTDNSSRLQPGMKIKVGIPFQKLVQWYMKMDGESNIEASRHALNLINNQGMDVGEVMGNTVCDGRKYITASFPLEPMAFLPEEFFEKA